jgi:hypothetical protein
MTSLEVQAMDQLYSNIKEQNIKSKSELTKKNKTLISEKNCCTAAVRYTTIGNAFRDIEKHVNVYLVKDEKSKINAFSRCSKTTQDGKFFCHIHSNTIKNNSADKVKIFEKDILPIDKNDKNRWLADISDDFFQEMGKRGAKKKNCENNFLFDDSNHPVLKVLSHKNAKLSTFLSIYASQLLKGNGNCVDIDIELDKEINKLASKKPRNSKKKEDTFDNLISMITSVDESTKKYESVELSDIDSDTNSVISELVVEDYSSDNENKKVEVEISDIEEDDDSDQESVSCVPIYTKDKEELWYNPENKIVYKMCDENGDGTELGHLKEISKDYYVIKHEKKYYTVVVPFKSKENGSGFKCVFTNALFDLKMNFIGIL